MSQIIETEETLIIETPERVQLAFALASIGNRFLAVVVDHFIQFFTIFVIAWTFISISGLGDTINEKGGLYTVAQEMSKWTIAIMIIVLFLIFAGYFVFFEWVWNGQTPGKRLMKLRVIREDGRPVTFWEALARNLLRLFDTFPGFVIPVYSIGLVTIFMSNRDQRLGDLFAGTVVVRERTDEAPTFAETFSNPTADAAFRRVQKQTLFTGDLKGITDAEMEVVETFLRRRWDLSERQRIWMAWRVALPIMYKIKPGYSLQDFTYEGFLEELIHRYYAKGRFLN
ncbi:MAG: RDD family protein [Pyrinomonadaceae bacterium]|nr:RDD family protein [Pyrinomonadaceae bacterium]